MGDTYDSYKSLSTEQLKRITGTGIPTISEGIATTLSKLRPRSINTLTSLNLLMNTQLPNYSRVLAREHRGISSPLLEVSL